MTAFERFAAGEATLQVGGCAEAPRVPVRIRGRAGVRGGESVLASEFMAPPREGFPLLARPAPGSATRDRKQWAAAAGQLLDRRLEEVGAVLLRGLPLRTPAEFSEFFGALGYATVAYQGHATRAEVAPIRLACRSAALSAPARRFVELVRREAGRRLPPRTGRDPAA